MNYKRVFVAGLLLLLSVGFVYADDTEEITLTTYYPAPYGSYDTLISRVVWTEDVTEDVASIMCSDGLPDLRLGMVSSLSNGGWNPISSSGDTGIIFSDGAIDSTTDLVIAPWSSTASGIKITNTGNVGIGTASPASPLHITDDDGVQHVRLSHTGGKEAKIGVGSSHTYIASDGYITFVPNAVMSTAGTPTSTEMMTLTSAGNLTVNGRVNYGNAGGLLYTAEHGNYGGPEAVLTVDNGGGDNTAEIWIGPNISVARGNITLSANNVRSFATPLVSSDVF